MSGLAVQMSGLAVQISVPLVQISVPLVQISGTFLQMSGALRQVGGLLIQIRDACIQNAGSALRISDVASPACGRGRQGGRAGDHGTGPAGGVAFLLMRYVANDAIVRGAGRSAEGR